MPFAIESLLYLPPTYELLKSADTLTGSKRTCPTVLHLSFPFYNNNSVTINKLKKWIIILACFGIGIFHTLALNFNGWLFDVIVTSPLKPKSVYLNRSIYCKPIDRTLKMLFIEESHSFLRPIIPGLWNLMVLG